MVELSPEEKKKIYEEEKARHEVQEELEQEEQTQKTKQGCTILAIIAIAIVIIIWQGGFFKSSTENIQDLSTEAAIKKVFGIPKDKDSSGIIKVNLIPPHCEIIYRFFPLGFFDYKDELGIHLAGKLQQIIVKRKEIKSLKFYIASPFVDRYGNQDWETVVIFRFSRSLYRKINWDNFDDSKLLDVVENLEISNRIQQ